MNCVQLIGNLTADVALKKLNNDKTVVNFTVAVNRRVPKNEESKADFVRCVAWGKTAETISKYFGKGDRIAITGSIRTAKYEKLDGDTIFTTEVLIESITFVERREI